MASLIYLFIYLNKVFPAVLKHFIYTMAARILMEGNLAVPMGNARLSYLWPDSAWAGVEFNSSAWDP